MTVPLLLPSQRRRLGKRRRLHHFIPAPIPMDVEYVDEKTAYTFVGERVDDDRCGQSKANRRRMRQERGS